MMKATMVGLLVLVLGAALAAPIPVFAGDRIGGGASTPCITLEQLSDRLVAVARQAALLPTVEQRLAAYAAGRDKVNASVFAQNPTCVVALLRLSDRVVAQGIIVGPDGRLYLATADASGGGTLANELDAEKMAAQIAGHDWYGPNSGQPGCCYTSADLLQIGLSGFSMLEIAVGLSALGVGVTGFGTVDIARGLSGLAAVGKGLADLYNAVTGGSGGSGGSGGTGGNR